MRNLLTSERFFSKDDGIIYVIRAKNGREISKISIYQEKEVLLKRNSSFIVTALITSKTDISGVSDSDRSIIEEIWTEAEPKGIVVMEEGGYGFMENVVKDIFAPAQS